MASISVDNGLARFTFEIEGAERVSVGLTRFLSQIRDFRPFWRWVLAPWFFGLVVENFHQQGRPIGGWRPLSPRYAAWKAKRYPGKTILRRSDRLIDSLTWTGTRLKGAEGIARFTEHAADLGTAVPYARPHQFGSKTRPNQPPQRRFLYLPPHGSRTIAKLLQRWSVETLRSHVQVFERPAPVLPGPGGGGLL